MGSCAAPSAKGDDKFITTDYLQQCLSVKFPFPDSVSKSPGLNRCTSCHIEKQVWQVTGSSPSATFSQFSISTRSLLYCKL
ncbi:hypothetical protein FCZ20_26695 [Escherichia coli]|nr:hypothetical protein [Escherichia coli]MDN2106125.1 hypothetical protein [Escherichia coli]